MPWKQPWKRTWIAGALALLFLLAWAAPAAAAEAEGAGLGTRLPWWSALPFMGVLLSISLFPLFAPHFWHRQYPKVALFWGIAVAVPFVWAYRGEAVYEILHVALADYLPFIILLASLFTIGGGIYVRGALRGSPLVNTAILALGTLLASWIGTTGAAMILIRPLLRANAERKNRAFIVVFFIFLVANIGGTLTPLGDPPLFLGFLRGVPFFWTFTLFSEFLFVAGLLLGIYAAADAWMWRREPPEVRQKPAGGERLKIEGLHNLWFLAGVLGAVILSGVWHPGEVTILGVHMGIQNLLRDGVLVALLLASWFTTRREVREANGYSWGPIQEVAILFAAIFATIIPPLAILRAGEAGALAGLIRAVQTPAHYFWATGALSAFLDNAPTYLTFLSTALGRFYPGVPEREAIHLLIDSHAIYLKAVSTGAVFMGACTYIGNAPNFMVKAIAEEAGVEMPSFFGFLKYTLVVLVPVFILTMLVFFL